MKMYDIIRTLHEIGFTLQLRTIPFIQADWQSTTSGLGCVVTFFDYVMKWSGINLAFDLAYTDIVSIRKTDEGFLKFTLVNNQSLEVRL